MEDLPNNYELHYGDFTTYDNLCNWLSTPDDYMPE